MNSRNRSISRFVPRPGSWALLCGVGCMVSLALANTVCMPGYIVPGPGLNECGYPYTWLTAPLTESQEWDYHSFRLGTRYHSQPVGLHRIDWRLATISKGAIAANLVVMGFASLGLLLVIEAIGRMRRVERSFSWHDLCVVVAYVVAVYVLTRSGWLYTARLKHLLTILYLPYALPMLGIGIAVLSQMLRVTRDRPGSSR